ncbi:winged helix-turn-helix transcriptional regulator [Neptunicoccus cionae]|uniref:winged helix-turn-helix transcriptional regulator n=1 Tax=Neptunicoccus cionae TaxID=2035344 RepID=UPI000C76BDD7|nr:helix-turn-helix domain-containing protein [Amylibacter cionae]PLS22252.1 transcriptional regulator [Amylibacter cionae]
MCAKRAQNYDCPVRDVLDRVGDAWSVLVILELSKGNARFNALCRVIGGISPRMLSVTLRHLERDGLVVRRVMDVKPPQVDYGLTDLGHSLHGAISALSRWAEENQPSIRDSRSAFDERETAAA